MTKQGKTVWLEATYTPVVGAIGEIQVIIKVAPTINQIVHQMNENMGELQILINQTETIQNIVKMFGEFCPNFYTAKNFVTFRSHKTTNYSNNRSRIPCRGKRE
ncbi:hypothetical protein ACTHOQ_05690 [Solibacillus silvestris]|uniref:hypothetical protein n=1 Tax=Solibacillus silvestris TaxID=76853 RepID=UPI003F802CF8